MYDNARFQALVESDNPTGEVVGVDRSLIKVRGLESVSGGALVLFDNGGQGMVREASEHGATILNLSLEEVPMGSLVVVESAEISIGVGDALIGRVVSAMGKPIDGKGPIGVTKTRPVFTPAPGVIERQVLGDPLPTGVAMVDSLFPMVLGQRMAILGDSKAGKSAFTNQMVESQLGSGRVVIFCLVAKRKVDVDTLVSKLIETGAIEHTIVVVSSMFDSLAESYLAPYAACAIGEHFWFSGRDTIMVYDDLTSHAKVWRELSLLARGNPGRESYPGDMFYAHSSLLERAGRLASNGATQSALPVVLTPGNDITAYLPTTLMSITDGQIVFDLDAFRNGIRPAVSRGLSVSRVGGRGQSSRQKKLTQTLFKRMVDYDQAAEFARFGSDLAPEARAALGMGKRIYEAFKQPPDEIYTLLEQELFLSAVLKTHGTTELRVNECRLQARELAKTISHTDEASLDTAIQKLVDDNSVAEPTDETEEVAESQPEAAA